MTSLTTEEKKTNSEQLVRVRNLKMLIQDVFKQFDLLFNEIDIKDKLDVEKEKKNEPGAPSQSAGVNLGQLQSDSVQSLTDLLYMP